MDDAAGCAYGQTISAIGQTCNLLRDGAVAEIARGLPLVEVAGAHLGGKIAGVS